MDEFELEFTAAEDRCEAAADELRAILEEYNVVYEVDISTDPPLVYIRPREEVERDFRTTPTIQ